MTDLTNFKEKFKDHELTINLDNGDHKILLFKNPNKSSYWIKFIITGNTLVVLGDCESAVYTWSSSISLEFLANLNLYYFSSKCEASPEGRRQEEFTSKPNEILQKMVVDHILDDMDSESFDVISTIPDLDKRFVECIKYQLANVECEFDDVDSVKSLLSISSEHCIHDIINNSSDLEPFLGMDFWERFPNFQEKTSTPKFHLAALKMLHEKYPNIV